MFTIELETTIAGLTLELVPIVKGKGTKTMSPCEYFI